MSGDRIAELEAMTPRDITRVFLNSFTELERTLRDRLRKPADDLTSFSRMLQDYRHHLRPQQRTRLEEISRLRNVIAHNPYSKDDVPIATPRADTVAWLEQQVQLIAAPPLVLQVLKLEKPQVLAHNDDLAKFLDVVKEPHNFSQAPVRMADGQLRLITTNIVARWIANNYADNTGVAAGDINIGPLVEQYAEASDTVLAKPRDLLVLEALQQFGADEHQRPAAIVITETGKLDQTPLGILTPDDIVELNDALGLLD